MIAAAPTIRRLRPEPDEWRPHASFVEPERTGAGEIVPTATVLLVNRECPWRCLYCDLWRNTLTRTVSPGAIPAQIDYALRQPGLGEARQLKLYNAGSFFDPKAIPPEELPAIAERVTRFERVIVECHPALIGPAAARFREQLGQTQLEVALGLEVADDALLARLNKRMTRVQFQRAARFLVEQGIAVRAFVIVRPPFVRDEETALMLARRSLDFAFDSGASVVSLIPGRFGPEALNELGARGEFSPPTLATLEAALDYGLAQGRGRVFADLWDLEKLAACPDCFPARRARLQELNLRQHPLPRVAGSCCTAEHSAYR